MGRVRPLREFDMSVFSPLATAVTLAVALAFITYFVTPLIA
jgi:hypothetical protein